MNIPRKIFSEGYIHVFPYSIGFSGKEGKRRKGEGRKEEKKERKEGEKEQGKKRTHLGDSLDSL